MIGSRSHLLCITLTPGSAHIVEAKRAGQGAQLIRHSTLDLVPGADLDAPAGLGSALAQHLKQQGYGSRHAVIGLCPRWVLARQRMVPPADSESMRGIVSLQIEREFAGSSSTMTFDYLANQAGDDAAQTALLLAGARSSVLRQIEQAAIAAGLQLDGITATPIAAATGLSGTVVLVEPGVSAVMRVQGGRVIAMASCNAEPGTLAEQQGRTKLIADVSRCLLQLPGETVGEAVTLLLPDTVSQADAQALADEAAQRLGVAGVTAQQADSAELLANHALQSGVKTIDFLHSRLTPPRQSRVSPAMRWAIRAAVLVLLIGGLGVYFWFDATSRRDDLQAEYDAIKDKAEQLEQVRNDLKLTEGWYDKRPPVLDCMLELTRTFPTQGEIRVETLILNDDMTGRVDCTAEDRTTMDHYFSAMRSAAALADVNPGGVRPAGGRSNWIDFPVTFRFDADAERGQP